MGRPKVVIILLSHMSRVFIGSNAPSFASVRSLPNLRTTWENSVMAERSRFVSRQATVSIKALDSTQPRASNRASLRWVNTAVHRS
jgi:hypothetical protein